MGDSEGDRTGQDGPGSIGPLDGGGRNGTSMAPGRSRPEISFEPVVSTASVGTEASPTRNATMITYRRVVPEKP
ncbi:hypothetical protein FB565_004620 [Actinoplanes lutulentus]|uniref:Uncharacterized protein n=1 Tax=Actinoplanes lutulentus TaxID=1287878 RepID=A0A327Z9V9_9ACTN|nr:hypothetical protein [Actinoplanes lutulentus]MBB2944887.1 hypothetical protein [Actinoplanes lutulentus]RAK35323.1 hypothetical protein B0I29_11075 [Actinoplanes lutulentus]